MFNYKWYIKDGYPDKEIKYHGKKVFTTFACGGGSTMGYKLAGYNVIAANDIDPRMKKVYCANHHPEHFYECGIGELLSRELPQELYGIDVLDGSPPCSVFSMSGSREKAWGKQKKFREGQAKQILDDLFFQFIDLANKLKPKVIIAENVKGMMIGNAKWYLKEIEQKLTDIGYDVQIFLLNAATMGVPQARQRVFVLGKLHSDIDPVWFNFKNAMITLGDVEGNAEVIIGKPLTNTGLDLYNKMGSTSGSFSNVHSKGSYFNSYKCNKHKPLPTIGASRGAMFCHYKLPNRLSDEVLTLASTFPLDYNFLDNDPQYILGMSVPPVMMAQVAHQVYSQWLSKL